MKYTSENQIMEKLGIETWRNLSKDKVVKFAAMMPDMDNEIMLKVIEQFPEFRIFATSVIEHFEKVIEGLNNANSKEFELIIEGVRETQEILKVEMQKPELSYEERQFLIEKLMEVTEMYRDLDSANKKFLKALSGDSLKIAGMTVLAAVVTLGGKVLLDQYTLEEGAE